MSLLQSDECFYEGTDSESTSFTSTLIFHIIFLVFLLIWCIFWFFFCYFNIQDENHKIKGIYATISADAPEKGINYERWKDYIFMGWDFFQLFSFSFLDEFSIKSSEESLFSVSWLDKIMYYVKMIILHIGGLGDLIIYFIVMIIIIICIVTFLFLCFYRHGYECCQCHVYSFSCKEEFIFRLRVCFSSVKDFFKAIFLIVTFGLFYKSYFNAYIFCCFFGFNYLTGYPYFQCCGCGLKYGFLKDIPFFIKSVVYDFLYIPILSSLIEVFVCTYTCDYNSSIMNKEEAYPPLDAYTSISCNSSYTIICFILSFFAIAFYHIRASHYICYEYDQEYSGDNSTNQRFQYVQMIGNFVLTVSSSLFYFQPYIPLILNLIVFIVILIIVMIIPARTAYTMEHSRLYISLYAMQVLTALMSLLSQIFPSSSSLFSLLTICLIPFGFVFGWTFYYAPSLNDSYPYRSLSEMMINKDPSIRLLPIRILLSEIKSINDITEENSEVNKENKENEIDKLEVPIGKIDDYKRNITDSIAFGSIYHRGLTLDELIKNAGNVLMESIRRDYQSYYFERYNNYEDVYKREEFINTFCRKAKEDYKIEVENDILTLFKCNHFHPSGKFVVVEGNNFVSSNIIESLSFVLMRDNYIEGRTLFNIGIYGNDKVFYTSEILEEILKRTSEYLSFEKKRVDNKLNQCIYKDYLLFPLFYSNSITISLQHLFLFLILSYYSGSFFNFSDFCCFYSVFIANRNLIPLNKRTGIFNNYFSVNYSLLIRIKEYLNILSPYLVKIGSNEEIFGYNDGVLIIKDDTNFEKEREFVEGCLSDQGLFIDISVKILSLFFSVFKNDWNTCIFFSTFINETEFIDTFRTDEMYKTRKSDIIVKKFFNRDNNDDWLMNKFDGVYDYKKLFNPHLYFKFEYDKNYNEGIINTFKQIGFLQKSIDCDDENDFICTYEENEENEKSTDVKEIYEDSFSFKESEAYVEEEKQQKRCENKKMLKKTKINIRVPSFINCIILLLHSEIGIIREYALITLSSLFDKVKNGEEESKELGPSFIYMLLCNMNEWGILSELKHYFNVCINERVMFNEDISNENKKIEVNAFHLFYMFVNDCFDMSLILDEKKRREFVINDYCNKRVIEWICSFYEYKEEREKVIRLLYILLSCFKEDDLYSFFNFEDSSVLLLLLENNESYNNNNMVCNFS